MTGVVSGAFVAEWGAVNASFTALSALKDAFTAPSPSVINSARLANVT
ncbi:MAG TPA: hypothetical protein VGR06_27405 [Actinophytocola sp.]|nr:hypothetical protein [Actinophytocola sp.]